VNSLALKQLDLHRTSEHLIMHVKANLHKRKNINTDRQMKFAIKISLITGFVATLFMVLALWTIESGWSKGQLPLGKTASWIAYWTAFLPIRLLAVIGLEPSGWLAIVVSVASWFVIGLVCGYMAVKLRSRVHAMG
jgi:hypothetical protein